MWLGPQPQSRAARLQVVDRIVADLHRTYGDAILAMALYGSLGRGTDGDYSDIELWCVLTATGLDNTQDKTLDKTEEWVYGPSKAEVNLYGAAVMQARAVEVNARWSLQQGELVNCRPLFGDRAYFEALRARVMSPSKQVFDDVIAEMVVGELYEWMGKLRNGVARDDFAFLPITACNFAQHTALIAALLHRHIYGTGSSILREALTLPTLPAGYAALVEMVMAGNLHDSTQVVAAVEAMWTGIGPWLKQHNIELDARNDWPWP